MYKKKRGISRMISDFIVSDPGMTTFALTDEEWNNAIKESPDLFQDDDMNFLPKTLIPENMLLKQIKLKDLRESASQHPAFKRESK